ncbi:MAG TPA: peptidase M3 [Synechococcus sp. M44_DOE_062]|nr:peptidase M3 [Synechococcus sp. M44_DOE_062]
MVFPASEPSFGLPYRYATLLPTGSNHVSETEPLRSPEFDNLDDLGEQVQQFAQRYRGKVAQLSPPELAVALQELAELTQRMQGIPTADKDSVRVARTAEAAWQKLERIIFFQSQLLFFPLELQSLPAVAAISLRDASANGTASYRYATLPQTSALHNLEGQRLDLEPELQPFRQFLCRLAYQRGHQQPEPLECLLHQQYLTGRLAWRQLWQVTLNSPAALPDPDHTLAQLRTPSESREQSLQTHASAEIRWAAYQRLGQHLEAHADLGGFILSTLIRDHLWEAQWRGYDSAADLYLARHGLTQTFLENLLEGIRDRLDLFQRYYRLKSRNMGRSIRICDLRAPWRDPVPPLTPAEATSLIWAALQDFCPECAAQAKPWLLEVGAIATEADKPDSAMPTAPWREPHRLRERVGETESSSRPGETGSGGSELLLKTLATLSRRLRPEDPQVWLDLEEIQGEYAYGTLAGTAPLPRTWGVQVHTIFLQQILLDHLVASVSGSPRVGRPALYDPEGQAAPHRWRERSSSLKLAQALLIHYLEAQLQAVFYQGLIGRLELLLYRSGIPEWENGATYSSWVSEEWLKLCQELCGDAVELLPEHQFYWVGMPELFLRPFSAYQASLASLVALACHRRYHDSPRNFLPHYLRWLASPPGSLTLAETTQMLQADLSNPEGVLQALEELEHWIETLEKLLEEDPDR